MTESATKHETILTVKDLTTSFKINNKFYKAISDIDMKIKRDEILAIVGESGWERVH